ncbi:MAG: peptidoglycan DD-metalloendopeptidase family protein, partial [Bacteroidota bacterium]|nr:peptidoglycan DD-metalloendopeptidase family protein [Bacteroidota bacterium]
MILLIVLGSSGAFAQKNRNQLEADKKKLEEDIKFTNQLLTQTRKTRSTSLNELIILNNQIRKRESLINTLDNEVAYLDRQIELNNDSIRKLSNNLQKLKEEYARMIYYSFKHKNTYDRLMFIFSAEDFNQAYRRLKYFQQYSEYRKTQVKLIEQTRVELDLKVREYKSQKADKKVLMDKLMAEHAVLTKDKQALNSTVVQLGNKEKNLKQKLRQKQKDAARLENAIKDIIAEEIRLAAERARKETSMKKADDMSLTPVEFELSTNFASNKGKLPWPSARGIISGTFGEHPHPILKHVKVKNNGINILTTEGEHARAVFEGEITRVMTVPNYNNVVIIRHGEYLTVYSNLTDVFVKRGDKVSTMQQIGKIYTDPAEAKTELHFEIWKAKALQNPSYWLTKH